MRKRQVNKLLEPKKKFEARDNKKYKVELILDGAVYSKEVESQMPGLYYLVSWKSYLKEKNI